MAIKIITCGLCKMKKVSGTRHGMRKHFREFHKLTKDITNMMYKNGEGYIRQYWWKEEDFK